MDTNSILTMAFITTWLSAGVRLAIPVLLTAVGEIYDERAGVMNIGIEGIMLLGALMGFLGSYYTGSPWMGTLFGGLAGLVAAAFLGWMFLIVQAEQTVTGIVFNLFIVGLTSMIYRAKIGITDVPPQATMFSAIKVPLLADIPFIGPILFEQNVFVYLVIAIVLIAGYVLYHTKIGLAIRAAGEHPRAADTAGINVNRLRFFCLLFSGVAAGTAGALLILGQLGMFRDSVTAGRGFIALAIVIFGRWNPYIAIGAAFIFGSADALAISLQMFPEIPIAPQFLLMLPYVATFLVMSGLTGKVIGPASMLKPYSRE